jgi:hypothetical protein
MGSPRPSSRAKAITAIAPRAAAKSMKHFIRVPAAIRRWGRRGARAPAADQCATEPSGEGGAVIEEEEVLALPGCRIA